VASQKQILSCSLSWSNYKSPQIVQYEQEKMHKTIYFTFKKKLCHLDFNVYANLITHGDLQFN